MYNYWKSLKDAEAERKKSMAPSARKAETAARKAVENEYKTCIVDGIEQKAGNVTVEPPGLFLGRGAHPKAGRVKARIMPEQITINHSADHPAPAPPAGHKWGEVVEKKDVTWLALWRENINGGFKYVFLDASSNFKTESDREKFEKARRLDECVKRVRADVLKNLTSKNRLDRMVATIVWLIDNFSLRAGNEKGEDEAETYGVCSLRCGHATLIMPNQIKLSFLGKDSMKFEETLTIGNKDVFKNMTMFLKTDGTKVNGEYVRKGPDDPIFAAPKAKSSKMTPLSPDAVNQFLGKYMKGLSAKVFRTYNASATFQGLLDQTEQWLNARPTPQEREITPANLRIAYNEANRQVAILCNHQKTVNHVLLTKALDRSKDKIFALRYQIFKERQKLLTHYKAADLKKEYLPKDYDFAKKWNLILEEPDLDKSRIQEHEEQFIADKKARMITAFERQESERKYQEELRKNKQIKDEDTDTKPVKIATREQLDAELKNLDEQLKLLARERKANKSESATCNVPSTARRILSKYEAIKKQEAEMLNKNNTSDVSLGTSKINYIDPRITVAWLKKWDDRLRKEAPQKKTKVKTETKEEQAAQTATSEKMELHLHVMNIGQFFPMTLQKKFRWAALDDNGKDISPQWTFVKDAQKKMRTLESGSRKNDAADAAADAPDAKGDGAPEAKAVDGSAASIDTEFNVRAPPLTAGAAAAREARRDRGAHRAHPVPRGDERRAARVGGDPDRAQKHLYAAAAQDAARVHHAPRARPQPLEHGDRQARAAGGRRDHVPPVPAPRVCRDCLLCDREHGAGEGVRLAPDEPPQGPRQGRVAREALPHVRGQLCDRLL